MCIRDSYYSSYKHVTLRSPGAIGGPSVLKTTLTKRQNTGNANAHVKRIISQSSKDNSITSSIAQESSKDKSSKRYSSLNTLSLTPVSYTHLDVYKRQHLSIVFPF